jgi:hypothetical protein
VRACIRVNFVPDLQVPIYWGAPNIDDYAPGPAALIPADPFLADPAPLAAYLARLAADEPLRRRRHLAFKDPAAPLAPGFLRAAADSAYSAAYEGAGPAPAPRPRRPDDPAGPGRPGPALGRRDPRCHEPRGPGGDGRDATDPGSQCYPAAAAFARDMNRGNAMRGCRLCLAATALAARGGGGAPAGGG